MHRRGVTYAFYIFGLNTAYTGLIASNASINTAGNNIANVETKGYSRQTVTQQASDAIRTHTTYGCAGAGVDTKSIDRNRNAFYDLNIGITMIKWASMVKRILHEADRGSVCGRQ